MGREDRENVTNDLLVVDYTDYVETHPQELVQANGVCFLDAPDNRIGAFCFLNPSHLSFDALNLEGHQAWYTREDGTLARNCECVCRSNRATLGKRWLAFLELKYPKKEEAIPQNMLDALDKFEECINLVLRQEQFQGNEFRIYAIASHPEYAQSQPFGSFVYNQDHLLSLKDKGIALIYGNAVKIDTTEFISLADVPARFKYSRT